MFLLYHIVPQNSLSWSFTPKSNYLPWWLNGIKVHFLRLYSATTNEGDVKNCKGKRTRFTEFMTSDSSLIALIVL